MRKAAFGMSMALFTGLALAACGNEPEPVAPVGPSFDRTTESTDTDEQSDVLPAPALPPTGSEPGEIPEVMEDTFAPDESRSDAAEGMVDEREEPSENPM